MVTIDDISMAAISYGEKKFSKTELIKKPFQAKRKLLSGILNCVDAAIEKRVAEPEFQYGAEAFEAHQQQAEKAADKDKATKNVPVKSGKSR
ncbi:MULTISPECIES: hypothetical protein [Bacteria]|uniref:hypothetical protein n=1 Tax=Bacteroides acidifaciens TaxID=85831 RepID=UPI00080C4778|nr:MULTISPECIES: hypothetical protein [Bacteria]